MRLIRIPFQLKHLFTNYCLSNKVEFVEDRIALDTTSLLFRVSDYTKVNEWLKTQSKAKQEEFIPAQETLDKFGIIDWDSSLKFADRFVSKFNWKIATKEDLHELRFLFYKSDFGSYQFVDKCCHLKLEEEYIWEIQNCINLSLNPTLANSIYKKITNKESKFLLAQLVTLSSNSFVASNLYKIASEEEKEVLKSAIVGSRYAGVLT